MLAVLADMSMVPMLYAALTVTVAPLFSPVASKKQVSCAKGKLFTAGEPPLVVAQPTADQLPPAARFQYLFAAAVNVIPLLPLQSPMRVPEAGAAAPAMVTSRKSTSVIDTAAAVMVRVVPMVLLWTKCRMVALVPAEKVSVPVTVWLAVREMFFRPAEVIPVKDRLLKLLVPLKVLVPPALVLVKLAL